MRCGTMTFACCLIASALSFASAQEAQVGPLGEPARLVVRGVKSAPPQEVARALFDDIDVAYASFPTAPLAELKRLLVEKAVVGFQRSGFPHAQVTIADRLDHLELAVDEGPRWTAGEIRVVGARRIDAGTLIAGLLPDDPNDAARAAAKESIWTPGRPAHLDEPARVRLARRVEALLAEQGYPAARFAVDVLGERGTAVLRVAIREEGRPLTLGDMEMTGNKIHTREQILAYLQLSGDVVLSAEIREEIEKRLEASGRFTRCKFNEPSKASPLKLTLDEFAEAPRLDESLTQEETALLRFAAWVNTFDRRRGELVNQLSIDNDWFEGVAAPPHRFLIRLGDHLESGQPGAWRLAISFSEDQVGVYSAKLRKKFVLNFVGTPFVPTVDLTPVSGAPSWDGKSATNVFIRASTAVKKRRVQSRLIAATQSPSAALSIIRKHHARCQWEGPILTARWKDRVLRVDSRDGRLVEYRGHERKSRRLFTRTRGDNYGSLTVSAEGFLQHRWEGVEQNAASFADITDSRRLVSGTTEFICQAVTAQGVLSCEGPKRLLGIIEGLSHRGLLRVFDDLAVSALRPPARAFTVPRVAPPGEVPISLRMNKREGLRLTVRQLELDLADKLLARGSRPWLVYREAAFILARKTERLDERLATLLPEGAIGPLAYLALAEAARTAAMPERAGVFARQGLEHVSLEEFRRDYADFLMPECPMSRHVLPAAEALRGLSPSDAEFLRKTVSGVVQIPRTQARRVLRFVAELSADANRSTQAALSAALDDLWQSSLEKKVHDRLREISLAAPDTIDKQPETAARRGLFFR